MKPHIYISKFPGSPEATKRQQFHFEADVNFAKSEGYKFIKSSDDLTFQFVGDNDLVEVDVTEEQLTAIANNLQTLSEEVNNPNEENTSFCIQCHNIMLIDKIINNTLLQEGHLSSESCNNMLKLAQLKSILGGL